MAEELHISTSTDKIEKYESLIPQIEALISGETDLVANLANIAAALRYGMDFFWVGFYAWGLYYPWSRFYKRLADFLFWPFY